MYCASDAYHARRAVRGLVGTRLEVPSRSAYRRWNRSHAVRIAPPVSGEPVPELHEPVPALFQGLLH